MKQSSAMSDGRPADDAALIEEFARAMFDVWPLHAISDAMAEQSGQKVGSPLTWEKVIEIGGDHNGLLRLARGAASLHKARLTALNAELSERIEEGERLNWLASNANCELSHGPVDGDMSECAWQVHRVNGGYNDREWTLIGQGDTPSAALDAARRAALPTPSRGGR